MAFKLTREEQGQFESLANELSIAEQVVTTQFRALRHVLGEVADELNAAIARRNKVAEEAAKFAEDVRDRLEGEWDERTERWQESDAGQDARGFIDEWDIATGIEQIAEVQIVEPEIDGDFAANTFGGLPHQA